MTQSLIGSRRILLLSMFALLTLNAELWSFTPQAGFPGAFGKISPSNGTTAPQTNVTLGWGNSSLAASYEYCYDTSNDSSCSGSWTSAGASTSATVGGLTYGTTYYWQVRAKNADGTTDANTGAWWSFTTQSGLPMSFGKISPSNGAAAQQTSATLGWGTSRLAASYEYCYDTSNDSSCNGSWTSAGASTSATVGGLTYGTTYYWQVRAKNADGTTDANTGAWWSFTTQSGLPGAFGKISPSNGAAAQQTSATLGWGTSRLAASYEYCYDTSNDGSCNGSWTSAGASTSATVGGLTYGTTYYWQVRAKNADGTADANTGAWWSFTTQSGLPLSFGKISPSNGAAAQQTSVILGWGTSRLAASYEYCYDTSNDGSCSGSWTSAGGSTSVTVSGLAHGTTYYWQVRAKNADGATDANTGAWWSFTSEIRQHAVSDFDGDLKSDIAVWRLESGAWLVLPSGSPGAYATTSWGAEGDIPVTGDHDGDGKSDLVVWRPSDGVWYIRPSSAGGAYTTTLWGTQGDIPVSGDFDGDGKSDLVVWRPGKGVWYVRPSSASGAYTTTSWGTQGDIPVSGDFDGDGESDFVVWRPSNSVWHILKSSVPNSFVSIQWGISPDIPVPGDYDADGKADIAVWRPSSGEWLIRPSGTDGTYTTTSWGTNGDIPVSGDYDGDGKSDIAVWRPGNGTWYIKLSGSPGSYITKKWGAAGDMPISSLTGILNSLP